jgi:hypothetical protein
MRKRFSAAFRAQIIQELLREEKAIAQLAAVYAVHPNPARRVEGGCPQGIAPVALRALGDRCAEDGARGAMHSALHLL